MQYLKNINFWSVAVSHVNRERLMTEFGDIFDYQQSAICFECLTLAFMAIYGLAIAWMVTFPKHRTFNRHQQLARADRASLAAH